MTVLTSIRGLFQRGAAAPAAAHVAEIASPTFAQVGSIRPEGLNIELTKGALDDVASFVGSARHELSGELFRLNEYGVQRAINESAARGVKQRWLVDPEAVDAVRGVLPHGDVTSAGYAAMPFKNHSKTYIADGDRALMTTGAFVGKTRDRVELVATFQGDAARAANELIQAGMEGSPARLRSAANRAAHFGIVVNEPRAGVQHLTGAVHDMIKSAKHDIVISTKIFNDPTVRAAVKAAEARGVRVRFTDIRANDMHANVLIADDMTYMGTAHFSPRGMGDMRMAYRKSRESGLVVRDAEYATKLRTHLDDQGMRVYLPNEFERTRAAYAKMDAYHKAVENGAVGEELAKARAGYDEGLAAWHEVSGEVRELRAADGITFTRPEGAVAALDGAAAVTLVPSPALFARGNAGNH
ncbi:MAG: PLD-like domain [Thermoleophilia bacterium]|nr:PLD-like domain [Thermoleophilia bacterium]